MREAKLLGDSVVIVPSLVYSVIGWPELGSPDDLFKLHINRLRKKGTAGNIHSRRHALK